VSQIVADRSSEAAGQQPHQQFRPDIQGLRAVAVGLVVACHAHIAGIEGGFVGVDVFFVISGFLITGLLLSGAERAGRVGFGGFYARRALRILPAATLVIVATALASVHVLNFVRARSVLTDSVWATFFVANVHFARQGTNYFAQDQIVSPLQHFWSLSVEEQFYVAWPALLAVSLFGLGAARRRAGRSRLLRGRVVLVLLVIVAASLFVSVTQTSSDPTAAYFSTFARAWELAAGALLAALLPALGRVPASVRRALSWGGLVGIVVAALVYNASTPFPGTAGLLPVLSACAVIAGGVGEPGGGAAALLGRQPLRYVGDISYSLYLWHWPLLILAADKAGRPLSTVRSLTVVVVAVALSALTYTLVENPFRRAAHGWAKRPQRALAIWPVAVVTVVVVSLVAAPADPFGGPASAAPPPKVSAVAAVATSVAQAERGAAIPASLSPSLANAAGDFKGIGACSGYEQTSSKICQYGDAAGASRMVVFGDSHSTMWIPALSQIATAAHWQFEPVVKEACSYNDYLADPAQNQCAQWFSFARRTIASLHPNLLVISVYHLPGWNTAMPTILRDLEGPGTRELLLSDAPGVQVAPVDCLLQKGATQKTCLWPRPERSLTDDAEARSIAAAAGADFVEVAPWFCADGECPSVVDGLINYADVGHITGTYARFLVPELGPALRLGAPARTSAPAASPSASASPAETTAG
jgi:peptidoglycan/LPS O-acetylase OafA/YrhL